MSDLVELVGAEDVQRALDSLTDAVSDLQAPHQTAGQLLLDRADTKVPRRSDRLAASGRVDAASDETALVYDEVYSGPIHNGWPAHNISPQPWAAEAVDDSADDVLGVFVDYLNDALRAA